MLDLTINKSSPFLENQSISSNRQDLVLQSMFLRGNTLTLKRSSHKKTGAQSSPVKTFQRSILGSLCSQSLTLKGHLMI